ncbi:alpha/beta hydrolase [Halobacillus sp. ACCC02827]|uniref:alpha/beta hydrolase n=1 Tax=Bacillaceae TaxID=186817 RepID=UPI0003F58AE2|nr:MULTISPECIES: alpha/beta hydrolase [Bacillaceae]QHT47883.1 alpha/beta hydrolase [Bacillus sp. SB49]WJE15116.1 alpha/beta hydrolase [Halobacillus sp. ACCC02827]
MKPVDPQVLDLLNSIGARMKELEHPSLDRLSPGESREYYQVAREFFTALPVVGASVEETSFVNRSGNEIPVRIYTPENEGPHPALVYFHGGGWVFGDIDSADNVCRYLSSRAQVVVVSVGYRLAPEHPYPAAFHDAVDGVEWMTAEASRWHVDPERIAVGGESSGGNLAAAVSLYFKDRADIEITYQFLITPVLDYRFDTSSYQAGYAYNLTKEKMEWFFGHYLKEEEDGGEVFVSPLRALDVTGLPPLLLVTAAYDPLRDEGFSYAERLKEAGGVVRHLHYDDLVHSFINMIGRVDRAREALEEMTEVLQTVLHMDPIRI